MKKIFYILFIVLVSISLASCKDKEAVDITVEVVSEVVVSNQISLHVVVPIQLDSMEDLYEIAMNVASQTYEKHFEMIGTDDYEMHLMFYKTSQDYSSQTVSYGQLDFDINQSISNPGLSLNQDALIFE
ncbi:MAG: hypothetical protein CVV58_05740 [Tenericutes bacterium HGW-Tenericutes-3]|nr:MAG: hypothetical protein CVV58_05740 [Tenericutes bacterium HGW-Tenericutes-3]